MAMPKGWRPGVNSHEFDQGILSLICKQCNNVCSPGTRFCTNCGSKLRDDSNQFRAPFLYSQEYEYKTYTFYKYNNKIQIQYPSDWQVVDHQTNTTVAKDGIAFIYSNMGQPFPFIDIRFLGARTSKELFQYFSLDYIVKTLDENVMGKLISSELITIDKRQAIKTIRQNDDGTEKILVYVLLDSEVSGEGFFLQIGYSATNDRFYEHLPIFEYVMFSLKFNS